MSRADPRKPRTIRSDGWTPERQLRFLDALGSTRNVSKAAAAAGMSREGAHRFRNRAEGTLFALMWGRCLEHHRPSRESHTRPMTDGRIMRLLGDHYRPESGNFRNVGIREANGAAADRTGT